MRIPLIIIRDGEFEHIFDTDTHDRLYIDKETGGIQYLSLHCSEGTKRFADIPADYPYMEFVGDESNCNDYYECEVYYVSLELYQYLIDKCGGAVEQKGVIVNCINEWNKKHSN